MLTTVQGVYRDGKVELLEEAPPNIEGAPVIVTFLTKSGPIEFRERGIDEAQAADLRWRLQSFAADWESPDMDVYDEL